MSAVISTLPPLWKSFKTCHASLPLSPFPLLTIRTRSGTPSSTSASRMRTQPSRQKKVGAGWGGCKAWGGKGGWHSRAAPLLIYVIRDPSPRAAFLLLFVSFKTSAKVHRQQGSYLVNVGRAPSSLTQTNLACQYHPSSAFYFYLSFYLLIHHVVTLCS